MPLANGTRFGPYEIVAPLGAGGMGEVYRARDTRLSREVALKILPAEMAGDPSRRQRFETEAKAVAALNHPNIVAVYDVGAEGGVAFMVSELVNGETLRSSIQRGPTPPRKTMDIAAQIADGLAAAHSAQIAHRDLKPENVMLTPEGRVKILDFGLAKSTARHRSDATATAAATQPGTILGTVSYMSPEQASGSADVDGRSDQFSLGLIVHELITGKKTFDRPTAVETMTAILREDPAPLPSAIPGPLRWTVERCLAKEPAQRYESTRDLFLELRQLRDHASEVAPGAISLPPAAARTARSPRLAIGALAAGLAAGVLLAALWLEAPASEPRFTPLATEPGIQTMPAWSPAGDRIAYSAEVDGIFQIFTRRPGSPARSQITRQNESCYLPFWSSDGTRIYYISGRGRLNLSLWSAGVAGGDAQKVFDGVPRAALSPDGKTLAVVMRQPDNTFAMMLSSPPGAPPRAFPQALISAMRASFEFQFGFEFTRDGRYLGLLTDARSKREFWKIPMDGGSPQELLQGRDMGQFSPTFSWLGDREIVWSHPGVGSSLMRLDLRRKTERAITPGVSQERFHALSPDGRTLSFSAGDVGYDLVEVALDGAPAAPLLATRQSEVAPSWAPDGVHFAYATQRSGWGEIWLRNRKDSSERMIVNGRDFPESVSSDSFVDTTISPDGSRVAYRRMHGATIEIWVSPLSGDTPQRLYLDPTRVFQRGPAWSPDGNWIAYYSTHEGKPAVLKARVGANRPPELVAYAAALNPVRWSPRGEWIAWNDGEKLTLASPDGKQKKVVSGKEWLTYGWSHDGASLIGISVTEKRRLAVGRVDIVRAREDVVADMGPVPAALGLASQQGDFPYRGFSLHPDGKSFLTSVLSIKGELWLLEDFDRRIGLLDRLLHRR